MTDNTSYFSVKRNTNVKLLSPRYIYARLILLYTLCYTAAFALGCLMFHLLDEKNNALINARVIAHFSADFSSCTDIFDYVEYLLFQSKNDIGHLIFIFMAGFTMFAGVAVCGLLIFKGLAFGFSVSYLAYAIRAKTVLLENPIVSVIVFSTLCAFCAAITIHLCVKSTIFSDEFKALCGRPRLIIRSKALYTQVFRFFIAFGAVLILNLIRCVV